MLVFAALLGGAGAVLSLVARIPVLIMVVFVMVLALVCGAPLRIFGVEMSTHLSLTIIIAIIALQTGYGLGVVLRGLFQSFFVNVHQEQHKFSDETNSRSSSTHSNH